MEIKIKESRYNRSLRWFDKLVKIFIIIFFSLALFVSIIVKNIKFSVGFFILSMFWFIFYHYLSGPFNFWGVKLIRDDSIEIFRWSKKEVKFENIDNIYVFGYQSLYKIFEINVKINNSTKRYNILDEPKYEYLEIFKQAGIKLKGYYGDIELK